jgi:acyl-CoA thioesterase-2
MGGYIASVALRAAGAESPATRPASFSCHYLGVAAFEEVEVAVTMLKPGRAAVSHRVEIHQNGRQLLEATVWSVGPNDSPLDHDDATAPDVAGPDELLTIAELVAAEAEDRADDEPGPPFPFWNNFECKPLMWSREWPPPEPMPPVWKQWIRFLEPGDLDDPWVDACRSVVLVDVQSWPAAHRPHAWKNLPIYGPSLDLYVAFHRPAPASEWLLTDGWSPLGADGLLGWHGKLWSRDRQLVASGGGQLICRRAPG